MPMQKQAERVVLSWGSSLPWGASGSHTRRDIGTTSGDLKKRMPKPLKTQNRATEAMVMPQERAAAPRGKELMMFLVAWAVICVVTVPLAGGRLAHLSDFKIRATLLLFAGLALQVVITVVVPDGPDWLQPSVHVLSYLLVLAFLVRNLVLPAMWIVALGGLLNFVVIVANGGVMPATSRALAAVERSPTREPS